MSTLLGVGLGWVRVMARVRLGLGVEVGVGSRRDRIMVRGRAHLPALAVLSGIVG